MTTLSSEQRFGVLHAIEFDENGKRTSPMSPELAKRFQKRYESRQFDIGNFEGAEPPPGGFDYINGPDEADGENYKPKQGKLFREGKFKPAGYQPAPPPKPKPKPKSKKPKMTEQKALELAEDADEALGKPDWLAKRQTAIEAIEEVVIEQAEAAGEKPPLYTQPLPDRITSEYIQELVQEHIEASKKANLASQQLTGAGSSFADAAVTAVQDKFLAAEAAWQKASDIWAKKGK